MIDRHKNFLQIKKKVAQNDVFIIYFKNIKFGKETLNRQLN